MFALREFAEAGGLLAYEASLTSMYANAATYVDKILKGARGNDQIGPTRAKLAELGLDWVAEKVPAAR